MSNRDEPTITEPRDTSKAWNAIPKWLDLFLWLDCLQGPKEPSPFALGTTFEGEGERFWSVLFTSGVLTGFTIVADLSHIAANLELSETARSIVSGITLFGVLYCLVMARIFRIKMTIRQAFFTFAFLSIPWIPVYVCIKFVGAHNQPYIYVFTAYAIPLYVVWSGVKGIAIISGVSKWRALLSVGLLCGIIIYGGIRGILSHESGSKPQQTVYQELKNDTIPAKSISKQI